MQAMLAGWRGICCIRGAIRYLSIYCQDFLNQFRQRPVSNLRNRLSIGQINPSEYQT